ncbi:MAG: peptidase domain-containing ABC transporter [Gammaproteobacteria bacterium]|nr:peptidase domain-containing ABC transporter [Gammaproteobacteria bacterium]
MNAVVSASVEPRAAATAVPSTEMLSERLARALREQDLDTFQSACPHAGALLPLLNALGWRRRLSEVIEALPHFAEHFDIIDLRNVMVSLGFESDAVRTRVHDIDANLLPCLFETRAGEVLVITRREGDTFSWFDTHQCLQRSGSIENLPGTAYLFTDTRVTHAVDRTNDVQWFGTVIKRFRGLVKHLLMMTLILNLIALLVPLFIMVVYDKIIGARSLDALPYFVCGLAVALLCELGLRVLRARTLGLVAGRLDYIIGTSSFSQLVRLPPIYTERSTVAAQLSKLRQFDAIRDFFTGPNALVALEMPFVLLFLVVIGVLAGPIALVPLGMLIAYVLFALLWLPQVNERVAASARARTARQQILMETFAGMRELKALGAERAWGERFRESSASAMQAGYRTTISQAVLQSVAQGLMSISGVAVLGFGAMAVMAGELSVGALIAVMALLWRVLAPLQSAFLAYVKLDHIGQGIRQLNQLMRLDVERMTSESGLLLPEVIGGVSFQRVSFRYGPDCDPALLGVSFEALPKEFIAVVGDNSSGKSTVLKLIAGMYRPQGGALCIDDTDVRQFNPVDLRRMVAYVPQKPTLFHGTIAQNLRLNDPMVTDARLREALNSAGILQDVERLPEGLESRLGDAATARLPSALIHGICLARAYLRDAPILLLDEPGASLDHEADQKLIRYLKARKGQQTIIMVSHRPSHVRLADKAIVMRGGMLDFYGDPEQALEHMRGWVA